MHIRSILLGISTLVLSVTVANAAPILDAGWSYDEADGVNVDTTNGAMVYNLTAAAIFRVTDYFNPGDVYNVFDNGNLILTTAFDGAQPSISPIGDPSGDAGWTDGRYSHGEVLLSGNSTHVITVQDTTGAFGIPAGLYERIDSFQLPCECDAPEIDPNSVASALTLLFGGVAMMKRRK